MKSRTLLASAAQAALTGSASALALTNTTCSAATFEGFLAANGTNATVKYAYDLPAGATFPIYARVEPSGLPALCAVQVNATTDAGTYYSFGLFLPEVWNNRFLGVASGGVASGDINWIDMVSLALPTCITGPSSSLIVDVESQGAGVGYGFAAMATDGGHTGGDMNGDWADNPESITDYGWRGVHDATVLAKALVADWYGSASEYNYFTGCSIGGRQGMKELQMFPEDYDGVTAGAPAWYATHLQLWNVKVGTYQMPENSTHTIPTAMFDVIAAEVLKQCDGQDGLVDTVISDPLGCHFDANTLACGAANATTDCLTAPQMDTLFKFYNDWVETNQTFVFNHLLLGSENGFEEKFGDGTDAVASGQAWFVTNLMQLKDFVPEDLTYDTVLLADAEDPGNQTAGEYDIAPFFARGGKFLHWHGLSDGTVSPGSSIYYYDHVVRELAPQGIDVDDFYRLFLVPGLE